MNWSKRSQYEEEINKEEEKKKKEVKKVRVNYLINKNLQEPFKKLCSKRGWDNVGSYRTIYKTTTRHIINSSNLFLSILLLGVVVFYHHHSLH